MNKTKTMVGSFLIQRLDPPRGGRLADVAAAFAFGGGRRNGGLTDEAMDILKDVFSFDYMGSSEFEWGAVPKALQTIRDEAVKNRLEAFESSTPGVYVLAPKVWHDEIEDRIAAFASTTPPQTKERVGLAAVLHPGDHTPRTRGWLELDNGFFFFADREMWATTCALFGVNDHVGSAS